MFRLEPTYQTVSGYFHGADLDLDFKMLPYDGVGKLQLLWSLDLDRVVEIEASEPFKFPLVYPQVSVASALICTTRVH